ncbi:MAG: DUF86 domain-containing protein [Thermoanaerobaculia bacterium]
MTLKQLEINTRLWHIQTACEKVLRLTEGKTAEEYAADDVLPDVVERRLTIVGEAMSKISAVDKDVAARLGNFPRIISFRNQLVHNYHHVEHDAVWLIVQTEVPLLLQKVCELLATS